jgi:hypothetical protein
MIEFFNFVVEVFFWMAVFWFVFQIFGGMFNRHVETKIEALDAEIAEIKKVYKQVKIEEYSGCFYIFDNETDQFLGQGRTAEEFAERLSRDLTIKIVAGDPDVVKRFRATVPQIEAETA